MPTESTAPCATCGGTGEIESPTPTSLGEHWPCPDCAARPPVEGLWEAGLPSVADEPPLTGPWASWLTYYQARCVQAEMRAEAAEAERDALREALDEVQYPITDEDDQHPRCSLCEGTPKRGHVPWCPVGLALARAARSGGEGAQGGDGS